MKFSYARALRQIELDNHSDLLKECEQIKSKNYTYTMNIPGTESGHIQTTTGSNRKLLIEVDGSVGDVRTQFRVRSCYAYAATWLVAFFTGPPRVQALCDRIACVLPLCAALLRSPVLGKRWISHKFVEAEPIQIDGRYHSHAPTQQR